MGPFFRRDLYGRESDPHREGAEVEEVCKGRVSLEEIFLTLMKEEKTSPMSQSHE